MPPQNVPLCYIDYFELKAFEKQQVQREAFSKVPILTKCRSSKKDSTVNNPLSGSFINQGGLTLVTREDTTRHHIQSCHKLSYCHTHLLFFEGPVTLPKSLYSFPVK